MERRTFLKSAGLIGTAAAGSALAMPAITQERRDWTLLHAYPKGYPVYGTAPQLFADFVTKASGGRITFHVFGAGEVVPAFETIDAVGSGAAHVGFGTSYNWMGKEPAMQFLTGLPFGMTAQEQNAWFSAGGVDLCQKAYDKLGVKFFVAGNSGTQMGGWFNKEINSAEDFRGFKMRMPGLGGEVLGAMGTTIVSLPGGELLPSMQSGTIDALEWVGPYLDLAFGFHQVAKFYYYPGWQEPSGINDLFVNMSEWNNLPEDLQEIIAAGAQMANAHVLNELTAQNPRALKTLIEQHGVQMKRYTDDTLVALATKSAELINDRASQDALSREIVDSLMGYRSEVTGYTQISEQAVLMARSLDPVFAASS